MGRVKAGRVKKSALCRKNMLKRWTEETNIEESVGLIICDNPIVTDSDNIVRPGRSKEALRSASPFSETSVDNEEITPAKRPRPTGFELVASYGTLGKTYDDAPTYSLVDMTILSKFLENLPCKYCLDINSRVTITNVFGFAQTISVHCNSCNQTNSFLTSQRIHHKNNESKRNNPFDVNRRIVKTFSSIGKGHMAMQTFSMCMNMPCLHHSAFDKHMRQLVVVSKQCSEECLKNAVKLHKH